MEQLKNKIVTIIKLFENSEILPETLRRHIPIILLLEKTGAPIGEMRKAIEDLAKEKQVLLITNDWSTRIMKSINQNPPSREMLLKQPTEDELFVCGSVINISQE